MLFRSRLATEVVSRLRSLVPGTVQVHRFRAQTIDGERELTDVVATRPGVPGPGLVVVAHRDAAGHGAKAELSGTAALLELARIAADGRLRRTITFISTSGGSGGYAGARAEARRLGARAEAVLVLGDVASARPRRPFVIGASDGRGQAPLQLRRTVEAAVRRELGTDVGGARAITQWARLAVPVALGEQGAFLRAGQPAVLLSASGERPPAAEAAVSADRLRGFGRAALRVLYTMDGFRDSAPAPLDGVVVWGKVLPGWAVRLVVLALLLPPLALGIDAGARLRRRREPVGRWVAWALAAGLPLVLACLTAVALAAVGLISIAPAAPIPPAALQVDAGAIVALVVLAVVVAFGWVVLRPALLRLVGARAEQAGIGGAGSVVGITLATSLVALVLWLGNPFAAALLLPAAHLWPWATTSDLRLPRPVAVALVLLALVPVVVVGALDARALGLGVADAPWFWTQLVAGRHVPAFAWVVWSLFWGCAVAAVAVAARRHRAADEQPKVITVRGPAGYAGPGSLGGVESALRVRQR